MFSYNRLGGGLLEYVHGYGVDVMYSSLLWKNSPTSTTSPFGRRPKLCRHNHVPRHFAVANRR